jgi:transposase
MRPRRTFTREFKLSVLQDLEQKSMAQVCREHEVHPTLLNRWKRDQQDYPNEAFKGKGNLYKAEAKIAQYERLIGQLYAEISFLKKTTALLQERRAEEKRRHTS